MKTCLNHFWVFAASLCGTLAIISVAVGQAETQDWARWRGPLGNGIVSTSEKVPTQWSEQDNVVWKTKVPGVGHSSPIVYQGRIFLTTADPKAQTQSVLCYDQLTGKEVWNKTVNTGGFPGRIHHKNTHASPSVAVSENHVLAVFLHHQAVHAVCLDIDGNDVWKKEVGKYVANFPFGYGTSPIAYQDTFIVSNENKGDSALVALKVKTGDEVWRYERSLPEGYKTVNNLQTSYSTPVITNIAGKDQLLVSGINHIASVNPVSGERLWISPASWDVSCGTMVWDKDLELVYASGGFPTKQTLAVKADGSGEKVWDTNVKCYEQSMIVVDGYLYGQSDQGIIYCWDAETGEQQWRQKVGGPVIAQLRGAIIILFRGLVVA